MSPSEIDESDERWIAVIGHPARDSRNDLGDQRGISNVRRLAPGKVTAVRADGLIEHDATTLGGTLHELAAAQAAGDPPRFAAAAVRTARLFEAAAELREAAADAYLGGRAELRLELLLNEQARRHSGDARWALGFQVRGMVRDVGESVLGRNTSLVRLPAATLGREEPCRLRTAIRAIGLGSDVDHDRLRALARELARDAGRSHGASLPGCCGSAGRRTRGGVVRRHR